MSTESIKADETAPLERLARLEAQMARLIKLTDQMQQVIKRQIAEQSMGQLMPALQQQMRAQIDKSLEADGFDSILNPPQQQVAQTQAQTPPERPLNVVPDPDEA